MSVSEISQIIQDYFEDRIRLGTSPNDVQDIADTIGVNANIVAATINQLACEYLSIEEEVSNG